MDMTQTDPPGATAINGYIGRVDAAARGLPPDRRIELLDQLREHLDAVSQSPGATESSVLAAIDRLGDPTEIAASEIDLPAQPAPVAVASTRSAWGPLEVMTVVLLIAGAVLFLVGQLGGLICLWFSSQWSRREQIGVTIFVLGSFTLAAVAVLAPMWGLPFAFFLLWLFGSPLAGIYLAVRLTRQASSAREDS